MRSGNLRVVPLRPLSSDAALEPIAEGLGEADRQRLASALEFAEPLYAEQVLSTGEPTWEHALGLAANLAAIGMDAPGRAAGVLFAAPKYAELDVLTSRFGDEVGALAAGVEKLYRLRVAIRAPSRDAAAEQNEILRKMVLGMVEDVRVVLIRLASRTQTLRWFAKHPGPERLAYAKVTAGAQRVVIGRAGVDQGIAFGFGQGFKLAGRDVAETYKFHGVLSLSQDSRSGEDEIDR